MKFGYDGRLYAVNPEVGLLRRRPGHRPADQPERDRHDRARHGVHQLREDRRRRHLVGGADRRAAGARDRLARQGLDAGRRSPGRAPQRPVHDVRSPSARRSRPSGRTRRACRSTRCCSAAGARPWCRWSYEARDWDARRVPRLDDVVGEDRRGGRQRRRSCGGTRWRCCRSAATTWPTTSRHWLEIGQRNGRQAAADLLRQLVPQGRRRQVPVARLRRELARAGVGLPALRGHGRGRRDADRPGAAGRRGRHRHRAGSTSIATDDGASCSRSTPDGWSEQLPQMHEHYAEFGDKLPDELRPQLDGAGEALERVRHSSSQSRWQIAAAT